jgi:hypothetical protein
MEGFLKKTSIFIMIGLIPFIIVGFLYLRFDPFKVLYDYKCYIETNKKATVTLDKDYVSTSTFIYNNKIQNYNSFIFGNSRSIFFEIDDWKPHLKNESRCFHFDATGESLWAINKKINFINKSGNEIKNVLFVLDYATLVQDHGSNTHLGIISPQLVDYSNIFKFHKTFFFAFLDPEFFFTYMDYKVSRKVKQYMKEGNIMDHRKRDYDSITNEMRFSYFENLIKNNEYYTPKRLSVFYKRDTLNQLLSQRCIGENQRKMLENIVIITKQHKTNIKIIISPLYDQKKINPKDLNYIINLFGKKNVFDFSGINSFTNDYRNYYESSHYRPHVAKKILHELFRN